MNSSRAFMLADVLLGVIFLAFNSSVRLLRPRLST